MSTAFDMSGWSQYENYDGYGQPNAQDVVDIRKALTVGNDINPPGSFAAGDGFAYRVESLEDTLYNTTFRMEHVRLFKAVPKVPAFNTVEEYNRYTSYGDADVPTFIAEGDLPEEADSTVERVTATIKLKGVQGRVSHVASVIKSAHGNLIAAETVAKTMHMVRSIEKDLFFGDSNIHSLEWDGFDRLIRDGVDSGANIIDMRGAPLDEDALMDGALTVHNPPAYGIPTHLHLNPANLIDLAKSFFPKARYDLMQKQDGLVGLDITGFTSYVGNVRFEPNVFLSDLDTTTAAAGDADKIPAAPTLSTAPASAVNASSEWSATEGVHSAGAYIWQVCAANKFGHSAATRVPAAGSFTTVAGERTSIGVTPAGSPAPTHFIVFRTRQGGAAGTERQILRVTSAGAAAETTINDDNSFLPGTTKAYMFQQDRSNMSLAQLTPMVRIPIGVIDGFIRWMQLYYAAPKLYSPLRNVIFENVGRAAGAVGQSP